MASPGFARIWGGQKATALFLCSGSRRSKAFPTISKNGTRQIRRARLLSESLHGFVERVLCC